MKNVLSTVKAPSTMQPDWWNDIVSVLGRPLTESDEGCEAEMIMKAYQQHCAGRPIPVDTVISIALPTIRSGTSMLELDLSALAVDGYAQGDTPTWEVVLSPSLIKEAK